VKMMSLDPSGVAPASSAEPRFCNKREQVGLFIDS